MKKISPQNPLLPRIEINPQTEAIGSVIWLHGLGANGDDFASMVPALRLPATIPLRFVFPHAPLKPVTINNGYVMPAWYDIKSIQEDGVIDYEGIAYSVSQIEQLIEYEISLGIPSDKIVIAGFSQGAVVALATLLHTRTALGGILALSGYLPFDESAILKTHAINRDVPIFLAHGIEDTVVPFKLGRRAQEMLKKAGFRVDWHRYPIAHSVNIEEIEDIAQWLKNVLS